MLARTFIFFFLLSLLSSFRAIFILATAIWCVGFIRTFFDTDLKFSGMFTHGRIWLVLTMVHGPTQTQE